ncbi:MAG: hypothetical protein U9N11_02600 [Campylobacterota bacterium]|nr:hypothetical protein [Campylobacterota bacterium]
MGKIIFVCLCLFMSLKAEEADALQFENRCIACHTKQQIPSELIYRRYLMKYSTKEAMATAMLSYLRKPKKESSIMPSQFFLKFPMKPNLGLDELMLKKNIEAYLQWFDVKKKLTLEK